MRKKREGSLGLVSSRILCENVFSLRLSVCAAFPVSLDPHAHEVLSQTRVWRPEEDIRCLSVLYF